VLVIATVCAALVVPVFCVPNVSAVGLTEIVFVAAAFPVPARITACGDPVALSVMLTAAERAPTAVGLKVTLIEQFPLTAREAGQLFVCAKSPAFVPHSAIEVIVTGRLPVFFSVTICAALEVATVWLANVRAFGLTEIVITGMKPVPLKPTSCGDPVASSLIASDAVRTPDAVGLNVTLTEHFALTANVAGQLLVLTKSPGFGPASTIDLIVTGWLPVLVTTVLCAALAVPVLCVPKFKEVGLSAIV
jgi:hypothetical protein